MNLKDIYNLNYYLIAYMYFSPLYAVIINAERSTKSVRRETTTHQHMHQLLFFCLYYNCFLNCSESSLKYSVVSSLSS